MGNPDQSFSPGAHLNGFQIWPSTSKIEIIEMVRSAWWLVWTPLKNDGVRQLRDDERFPILMGKYAKFMATKSPPTSIKWSMGHFPSLSLQMPSGTPRRLGDVVKDQLTSGFTHRSGPVERWKSILASAKKIRWFIAVDHILYQNFFVNLFFRKWLLIIFMRKSLPHQSSSDT